MNNLNIVMSIIGRILISGLIFLMIGIVYQFNQFLAGCFVAPGFSFVIYLGITMIKK